MDTTRSRRRFLVALFVGAVVWAGILFAWSYCWGWVGQGSPALQYFVRPVCPAMSAEARYADTIDVIVPAHLDAEAHPTYVSPSGRYIITRLKGATPPGTYLYDTRTEEITRTEYFDHTSAVFVTDKWVVTQKDGFFVYNIHDGDRMQLRLLDVRVNSGT